MRIFGQSLFSKGVLAKIKAWGLVTKGILDETVQKKGHSSEERKKFEIFYKVVGIKSFIYTNTYIVFGTKLCQIGDTYSIQGIKKFEREISCFLKGFKSSIVETFCYVHGQKTIERTFNSLCFAKKQYRINRQLEVSGIKSFKYTQIKTSLNNAKLVDKTFDVVGVKQKKIISSSNIKAQKSKVFDLNFSLVGERNVEEILVALLDVD